MVNSELRLWHCHGCLKGGDCFSFVMEWLGVAFPTAVDMLAREAGVERPARPAFRPARRVVVVPPTGASRAR